MLRKCGAHNAAVQRLSKHVKIAIQEISTRQNDAHRPSLLISSDAKPGNHVELQGLRFPRNHVPSVEYLSEDNIAPRAATRREIHKISEN